MDNIGNVKVKVNEKELPLSPFVTGLVGNLVWAIVSSLKTEGEAHNVVVEVSR